MNARGTVNARHHLGKVFDAAPHNVHQDAGAVDSGRQPREVPGEDLLHARIRQTDGVDHSRGEFRYAWSSSSGARFDADRLRHEAAERTDIQDAVQFAAVSGGTGRQEERILK